MTRRSGAISCEEAGGSAPAGAVMGFNLAACPSGWTDFAAGAGRFLVGTGADGQGNAYGLGAGGGEAFHQLTEAEMPRHNHRLGYIPNMSSGSGSSAWFGPNGSFGGWATTSIDYAGGDQPHENRPPYIAVRWCVKN